MGKRQRLSSPMSVFGIDVSQPGEYIAARATKRSVNFQIRRSLVEKRPGTTLLGLSLAERVQLMAELDNGQATYFTRIGPTKFEELDKTTLLWSSRANAILSGTEQSVISAAFPLLSGARVMVYTNGVDPIRKYLGGTNDADLGGSPPLCKYVIAYGGYLLLLNITDGSDKFPWRVDWCDAGDIEEWGAGDAGSNNLLEDSGDITGGGIWGQYFTIHKENAIYLGAATNTSQVFRFERKETGAGCVANLARLSLPSGEELFLARDGFRIFNGTSAPSIEAPINDELRESLNPEMAYKSCGIIIKELDEAWIAVPIGSDSEPSTVYKFNYKTRQMHKDVRNNLTAFGQYRNTKGQTSWDDLPGAWDDLVGPWDSVSLGSLNPIYTFGFADGKTTYQAVVSSDEGGAISGEWDSKDLTSLDYDLQLDLFMRWQEIRLWAKGGGTVQVYYTLDGGVTYLLAGSLSIPSEFPSDFSPLVLYIDAISVRFGIRIVHATDGQSFQMKNWAVTAVPREEAGR